MMKKLLLCLSILSVQCTFCQTWTSYTVGSAAQVMRIEFPTNDTGYISMDNGTMRKTVNGAALNWTSCTAPMNFVTPLAFINGTKGFAAGLYGIKMTIDGAATWSYVENDSVNFPVDFCAVNPSVIYAAYTDASGTSLYLHKSTNGGLNWSLMPITTMVVAMGDLLFIDSDTGYISAADCIFKTTDGGVSWDTSYYDINGDMISYLGTNDGVNIYAATQSLQFLVSTDAGSSWNPVGPGNPLPAYGISFISSQTGFACGGDGINSGYIDGTNNGGFTWTNVYNGVSLNCMDFPNTIRGYAGGKNGTVVRYEAGPQAVVGSSLPTFSMYPNPAYDIIVIEQPACGAVIKITNSLGEIVHSEISIDLRTTIDVSALCRGIYFCSVESVDHTAVQKLIVQ